MIQEVSASETWASFYRLHGAIFQKAVIFKLRTSQQMFKTLVKRFVSSPSRYSSYLFLTSVLDEVSGQRHAPAALYPPGKDPGTHWRGGWVGPRAGLYIEARGKILP
jgi:hypothetical protein